MGVIRRGRHFITKRGYRACPSQQRERLLMNLLPGTQKDGQPPAHFEPQAHEQIGLEPDIQNGDTGISGTRNQTK